MQLRADNSGAEDNRAMLEAAGYVLASELSLWQHRDLDRALDARIAQIMTAEQLRAWIAVGQQ